MSFGPSEPATFSVDAWWDGAGDLFKIDSSNDLGHDFSGQFAIGDCRVEWTAENPVSGFSFVSDPASTSTTVFAKVGEERNGVFNA